MLYTCKLRHRVKNNATMHAILLCVYDHFSFSCGLPVVTTSLATYVKASSVHNSYNCIIMSINTESVHASPV